MSPQAIEKLTKSPEGQELVTFLVNEIRKLDRVSDIIFADDRELAVELLARQRASQILATILKPFLSKKQEQVEPEREPDIYYDHLSSNQKPHAKST
jgi:hypothetical protein